MKPEQKRDISHLLHVKSHECQKGTIERVIKETRLNESLSHSSSQISTQPKELNAFFSTSLMEMFWKVHTKDGIV